MLAESEDFPHLVQALDDVVRKLGGTARRWRFDRMATVCYPSSGQVTAAFAAVAKYYGVGVDICPPRRGNRKGVVEKANHSAAQRWWRTVPDGLTVVQAQSGVDKLSVRMDDRRRRIDGAVTTVGELAAAEPLLDIPVRPFPAELEVERTVSPQSLVAFDGNFYSVPPGLPGVTVKVLHRLGEDDLRIVTPSPSARSAADSPRGHRPSGTDGSPELSSLRPARHDRRPARHPGSRPPRDYQPRHRHRPAQTPPVSFG
ncbi:Mu transposase domain-containing protein [Streptomyces coelicoflavus]|uniref:Mu transposase domain-containing protein n=1 Tax=Streptomyces coelicoflavus TaxID=285562 RepID=UPI001FD48759|nr:transposase [Streptomyces coelicoflavus]